MTMRKQSILTPIKSREDLIQESDLPPNPLRKTKIVCSVNDRTCNIDMIRDMILAGADGLSINTAYIKKRKSYEELKKIRDQLESEFDRIIPINMMLKGRINRIGALRQPEIYLQKGNEIRLTQDSKVMGDSNIVSVDQDEFFQGVHIGDTIVIDSGQVILQVTQMEDDQQSKEYLIGKYPQQYSNEMSFRNADDYDDLMKKCSFTNSESPITISSASSRKALYMEKLQQYKKNKTFSRILKSMVCIVMENSQLRAHKPLVVLNSGEITVRKSFSESDGEEVESQITSKDINDFTYARKLNYDSITISNVSRPEDIEELRYLLGAANSYIQIYVRITSIEAVQNFDKLIMAADGCIIARSYIALQTFVEDAVKYQHDMIKQCRQLLKPVIISTQILESMLTQSSPTFTEMGDIANLLDEHIDGIMLTGETTYGNHPMKVVKALARVCNNIEQKCTIHSRLPKLKGVIESQQPIASVLAQTTVETALIVRASMIMIFTTDVESAMTLSKLQSPCLIVAITNKQHVARALQYGNNIISILLGSLYGAEELSLRVLESAKEKQWVKNGDYVLVISGVFGTNQGNANQMRILQV